MTIAQIAAVAIFLLMFVLIIIDKIERHYVTLACGILTLGVVFGLIMHNGSAIVNTLNVKSIFTSNFWYSTKEEESSGISWSTIIFIAGMMIMVEGMAKAGFFRWLCLKLAKLVKYKTDGLFQSQEEIDNYAKQEVAGSNYVTKPGDIKYVDVNGDKVVNSKDMTYLGNGNVPEIVYGINGALKWKNMDFSFLLQGAGRVQVYLNGGIIQPYFNQGNLPQLWITDSWSETNRNARYPRLANTTHNLPATDVSCVETYLYDASYLRLKNIEIGYNLPKKWLSALTITGLRVYVNATNLLTLASVPQIDPENIHSQGWSYPQMKAFNFGLTLQF